jgi:alpha-L-rhamnosidase
MVLGVYPTIDGFEAVRIKPEINALPIEWAKGRVSTPLGIISVDWKKENGRFTLALSLPEGMSAKVILPNGEVAENVRRNADFDCKI